MGRVVGWAVSIHAPAWGATFKNQRHAGHVAVSIHAPAWGATGWPDLSRLAQHVSIHAPAWGATAFAALDALNAQVSIHAPAWGATLGDLGFAILDLFRSTPPHGGRPSRAGCANPRAGFDPRPRMGGDPRGAFSGAGGACFDPRPRMGGDRGNGGSHHAARVSIHAPAWGATLWLRTTMMSRLFRSTPPHGGRRPALKWISSSCCFDPRPRMGGDARGRPVDQTVRRFDPRPRMGGDTGFSRL